MSTEAPPAYNENAHPPELKQEPVELAGGLKAQTFAKQGAGQVLVQLTARKLPEPTPVDVLVIVDISGSMDTELLVQNQEDQASTKDKVSLSRLDLVRHCLLTMIKTKSMRNFGMITFSDSASVVVDMKSVQANKKQMTDAITALKTEGGTNLRDALIAAAQFLTKLPKDSNPPVVYLLTDGLPTDGYDLNSYCEAFSRLSTRHFAKPCALHSFGFGYVNEANNGVDCGLLDKLSRSTGGTMGYISDPSMMEVLLHSHAILAQARAYTGVEVRVGNEQFNIGTLSSGQTHSLLINKADSLGPVVVQLSSHQTGKCAPVEFRPLVVDSLDGEMMWAENTWRFAAATLLNQTALAEFSAASAGLVAKLITDIKENTAGFQGRSEFIQNLLTTLQGEVSAAAANRAAYVKWGRNYYRALSRALFEQQRINRHDVCLKAFNNDELVTEMIEANYDTFLETAAPPSSRVKYNPVTNKVVPVAPSAPAFKPAAIFNRRNAGGCFTGNGRVQLADGGFKTVEQVEVGDLLATSNGASASVLFILRTKLNAPITLCRVDDQGLYVTPYHPIRVNNSWVFPTHVLESETVNVPFVYDFVLDQHHTICVNEQELVTLGHGLMQDPVTAHAFFGTRRVVEDIEKLAVKGVLEIEPSQFVRNEHGLIASIQ